MKKILLILMMAATLGVYAKNVTQQILVKGECDMCKDKIEGVAHPMQGNAAQMPTDETGPSGGSAQRKPKHRKSQGPHQQGLHSHPRHHRAQGRKVPQGLRGQAQGLDCEDVQGFNCTQCCR